jgi:hypothetical protein
MSVMGPVTPGQIGTGPIDTIRSETSRTDTAEMALAPCRCARLNGGRDG